MSAVVGFRRARNTRALGSDRHLRPGNDRSSFVRDGAKKATRRLAIEQWADGKNK